MVIHNLVDFSKFKVENVKKDKEVITFFSLAYLVEGKGMNLLLKALKEAFKNENDLKE